MNLLFRSLQKLCNKPIFVNLRKMFYLGRKLLMLRLLYDLFYIEEELGNHTLRANLGTDAQ